MGIRTKIMMGFIILASMLFISGAISIYEITKLGKSVKGLIYDNYKSIEYSRNMLDALDNQESALLFFVNGDTDVAKGQYFKAHHLFESNLDSATNNLQLEGEQMLIDSARFYYDKLKQQVEPIFSSSGFSLGEYLEEINSDLLLTSKHVKNLMIINQDELFKSAGYLETSAQRAAIPGLIVIITSLIFTFVFTYLVHHYFVSPIIRLTKGINDFVKFRKPFDVVIETKDELFSLKESIVNLISPLHRSPKKNE
ncbi:MAG: MCP four helix bundle domain-containing protein [Bacteroidales bacterium]|nr:MCP four helix bundle domain-containing protein [Bacteroidales bacterium]